MPAPQTQTDALGVYATGGAANTDPDASLGGDRSEVLEVRALGGLISNPIPPIVVELIHGAMGEGEATIRAVSADVVALTPVGGAEGPAIRILDGETKLLQGADRSHAMRISRDLYHGSQLLTGTMTIAMKKAFNGVVGMSDEDSAGSDKYRGLMLRAHGINDVTSIAVYIQTLGTVAVSDGGQLGVSGAGTITTTGSLADWPETGWCRIEDNAPALREIVYYTSRSDTVLTVPAAGRGLLGTAAAAGAATDSIYAVPGVRLALEAPGAGAIQIIADENTEPGGRTWKSGITAATGATLATLASGSNYGLWLHRETPAGATASHRIETAFVLQFGGI